MKAIEEKRPGSYLVGGEQAGQPEYFALEVIRDDKSTSWSAWKLSWKDCWRVLRGHPIRVGIVCSQQPPIIVTAGMPFEGATK